MANPQSSSPNVSWHEASSNTRKFCKGKLVGYDLHSFKTRFEASVGKDPTLFEPVKAVLMEKLSSKKFAKVQAALEMVIWLLLLKNPSIDEYWASNIEIIRGLKKRCSNTAPSFWSFRLSQDKQTKLSLYEMIAYVESLLQYSGKFEDSEQLFHLTASSPSCTMCSKSNKPQISGYIYKIAECQHSICESCLKRLCTEYLKRNDIHIRCQEDTALINREIILSVLNEAEAQRYASLVQQQNSMERCMLNMVSMKYQASVNVRPSHLVEIKHILHYNNVFDEHNFSTLRYYN
jgi:hypothetical protein